MLIRRREAAKEVIGGVSVKVSKVWRKIQSRVGMYYIHKKKTYCSEKKASK